MPQAAPATPYCGVPPSPGDVAWNLDPWLIAALLLGLLLAWGPAGRGGDRRILFAGWAVLAAALLSPLCNLSVALFSARVGQHLVLLTAAAPLLALGLRGPRWMASPGGLAAAAGAFAVALWAWHLPGPYAATFRSDLAYWAMQASLLGTAAWLWRGLLLGVAARPDMALLAGLATAAQTGALGALLTFAPRPLFAPHGLTTLAWGLTPLEDQQLGGLLMWVPGGLAFAAVSLPALARALRDTALPRPRA
ncbi:cytochrome c oxidase assembly protein [Siccirubricoccus sp. G192]|uniref:cytochrome c oxidase assembly protein n=1 Tax=Siccirubricoccus sp. G192 TaxID=2849651 RepID=UPI001C2CBB63|nr:cytochrome c oxidase assembly protein [Siccirubricoccus sp. G192]MBV1799940.1 cytochrome c oxidase assembly protein [Siccirubricoccus sp. G192]